MSQGRASKTQAAPRGERRRAGARVPSGQPTAVPGAAGWLPVLAAAVALRYRVLGYGFFADDYLFLDQVRGASPISVFMLPDPLRNYWRPVGRQAYFWFIARLGESPLVAHVLNLAIFLALVALVFALARRLAGTRAGAIAAGIVAVHEAADVPVLWSSGSQDLLAVLGALAALWLLVRGRALWAAVALLAGLLSKETICVTPLIALPMVRRPGERWRAAFERAAPLFVVSALWLPLWLLKMKGGTHSSLHFDASSLPAALVHLPQVFLGAQWDVDSNPPVGLVLPPIVAIVLVVMAILVAGRATAGDAEGSSPSHAARIGLTWAILGALPVTLVVHTWSSYYYLFAVCGLALATGAWLARSRPVVAMIVVALLAWGSESARRLESFATAPGNWGTQSHLSRFYFDRSMRWVSRYLQDMRAAVPSAPAHSTLYFAGIPAFASWQSGDGALVRWAYRDSTLRSYYFADFDLATARRGDVLVFTARNDSLTFESDPVKGLQLIASGQALSERFATADGAVTRGLDLAPDDRSLHYWRAWLRFAGGDSTGLARELHAAGCEARPGPSEEASRARRLIASGDAQGALAVLTEGVQRHGLDPEAHAQLADLLMRLAPQSSGCAMEALAARTLTPTDAVSWRRWAHVQVASGHAAEAFVSLSRYFELAGPEGKNDADDLKLLEALRAGLPGGSLAQSELRRRPRAR